MNLPRQALLDRSQRTVTVASQGRTVRELIAALERLLARGVGNQQVEVRSVVDAFLLTVDYESNRESLL